MLYNFEQFLPKKTAQTQIRLLLKKQSDQGLPCLLFSQTVCSYKRKYVHEVLVNCLVSLIDRDFGYYFAVLFVFSIGLACFILYVILRTAKEIIVFVMLFYYLFSILALLMAISVSAAFVNEAVSFL